MKSWIVDTGPLVAYLDARDPAHATVVQHFDGFRGDLFTTSAVVTETMHFVAPYASGPTHLVNLIVESRMTVFDFSQAFALREAASLMEKYADLPMDFADATLVLLAENLETEQVLTLDRRGFRVFRTRAGKSFDLVLDAG